MDGSRLHEEFKQIVWNKYISYWFYLTYLILPSATSKIFQVFSCTDINPKHEIDVIEEYKYRNYLTVDVSIACNSTNYKNCMYYAICMIAIYPLGIPLFYLWLLYPHRNEINNRQADSLKLRRFDSLRDLIGSTSTKSVHREELLNHRFSISRLSGDALGIAFLWEPYKPEYWYWEFFECYRRILLTSVVGVVATGTSQQRVLALLLTLLTIKVYSYISPYALLQDDMLAEVGQYQIFLTFFILLIIKDEILPDTATLDAAFILINTAVVLTSIYFTVISFDIWTSTSDPSSIRSITQCKNDDSLPLESSQLFDFHSISSDPEDDFRSISSGSTVHFREFNRRSFLKIDLTYFDSEGLEMLSDMGIVVEDESRLEGIIESEDMESEDDDSVMGSLTGSAGHDS